MSAMSDSRQKAGAAVGDAALLRRLLSGDEAAFRQFFDGHFPRLYRFALKRTDGDRDEAEEIVQKTMIAAMRGLHTFRGESALLTWLCAICRREAAVWRAARVRQTALLLSEDAPEIRDQLAALASMATQQPDELFDRGETARLVRVALDLLPGSYSEVLEWKYIYGLTVLEISERTSTGPKAVESLLGRARKSFRQVFSVLAHGRVVYES
jgi:RNA polymerase sigma-70 factor (ECF subfamily)